ncbi:MAG: hemerythrin domain-containing protein [Candidatus Binatia bacterium]
MPKRHPTLIPLSQDHHHGLALALRCRKQGLGQIKPMGAEGLRERAREFLGLYARDLTSHFRAEEEILFPRLRAQAPDSGQLIDELLRDHETIRRAIPKLEASTLLDKLIFDLGDLLERHIRREERELFPLFEQHAGEMNAEEMGAKINQILSTRSKE